MRRVSIEKLRSSNFWTDISLDGFSYIAQTRTSAGCLLWFLLSCTAICMASYHLFYDLSQKMADATKLTVRSALSNEISYPEIKFCYHKFSDFLMDNNYTYVYYTPIVLWALGNLHRANQVIDDCDKFTIESIKSNITEVFGDSRIDLQTFFDEVATSSDNEEMTENVTHEPGPVYFDNKKGLYCMVFSAKDSFETSDMESTTFTMNVPFQHIWSDFLLPIIHETERGTKSPGMIFLDNQPVFPLWPDPGSIQTVVVKPKTWVARKDIQTSYPCPERLPAGKDYEEVNGTNFLINNCDRLCDDDFSGIILDDQVRDYCSQGINSTMVERIDYTVLTNSGQKEKSRQCLNWNFNLDGNDRAGSSPSTELTKLHITFPPVEDWLITEHVEDLTWLDMISNIGGAVGLWTGASILSIFHVLYFMATKEKLSVIAVNKCKGKITTV